MFYVHVQKKVSRAPAGVCAHFCPICRAVSVFSVQQLSTVTTINMIPVGKPKRIGDELTCSSCTVPMKFPPGQTRPVAEAAGADLADLAADTSPWTIEALTARLELESRVPSGDLSDDERRSLIAEPLRSLEHAAERAAQRSNSKTAGFLAFLMVAGAIATPFFWYFTAASRRPTAWDWALCVAVSAATLAALILLIVRMRRDFAHARRTLLLDPLARSLTPLNPDEHELRAALRDLRKSRISRYVKPERLLDSLRARTPPG